MLTMLRNAVFIWPMVSWDVICAVPLQLAPAMFWLDAHILRASSSTVWACTSKRPAIDRISCGSVIKRVGIILSPYLDVISALMRCAATASPRPSPAGRRAGFDFHGSRLGSLGAHTAPAERTHEGLGEGAVGQTRGRVHRADTGFGQDRGRTSHLRRRPCPTIRYRQRAQPTR